MYLCRQINSLHAHTTIDTEQTTGTQQQATTAIVAMHTDRYNRYALLPHSWHGWMDRYRVGTHIRLSIWHTLRWHQRYHHRLSGGSTALHRHHTNLHHHLLHSKTPKRQLVKKESIWLFFLCNRLGNSNWEVTDWRNCNLETTKVLKFPKTFAYLRKKQYLCTLFVIWHSTQQINIYYLPSPREW